MTIEDRNKVLRQLADKVLAEGFTLRILIPELAGVERISGGWAVSAKILVSDSEYDFHTQITDAIAKTAG